MRNLAVHRLRKRICIGLGPVLLGKGPDIRRCGHSCMPAIGIDGWQKSLPAIPFEDSKTLAYPAYHIAFQQSSVPVPAGRFLGCMHTTAMDSRSLLCYSESGCSDNLPWIYGTADRPVLKSGSQETPRILRVNYWVFTAFSLQLRFPISAKYIFHSHQFTFLE